MDRLSDYVMSSIINAKVLSNSNSKVDMCDMDVWCWTLES